MRKNMIAAALLLTKSVGALPPTTTFPTPSGDLAFPNAVLISGSFDGKMLRFSRNPNTCQEQVETSEKDAMFILEHNSSISNAIIAAEQGEGIHCRGSCNLTNIWWENVCEDAGTFKQGPGNTSYVIGGGAKGAEDKIFQFNGRGTVVIRDFYAETYGKLIRSCGDCRDNGGPRNVIVEGVSGVDGGVLCGINSNYNDTCIIKDSCQNNGKSCDRYMGVSKGNGSSTKIGSGADGISCFVTGFNNNSTC